jgi:hypothetical protein
MAVMNDKQNELLKKLEGARVTYDQFEEELAQRVADEKWERKAEIRELVREARDAGVPYRQIGFALQTSDHVTLKNYEKDIRR